MRVYFVNSILGTGSTGRIVAALMEKVEERGGKIRAAYGRGKVPKEIEASEDTFHMGNNLYVYFHGAMSRITDMQGRYSAGPTKALISDIKSFGPDIIHLHNIHGYYLHFPLLFEYLHSFEGRIVWTLHDCFPFTGHCTHFEAAHCDKWKSGCFRCPEKGSYPKSILLDSSKSNYELKKKCFTGLSRMELVTPSEYLKSALEESFLSEYKVTVIPTGIDLEKFTYSISDLRIKMGIGKRFLILGAANPWRQRKGYDDFLKLAEILQKNHGDDFKVAMIGLKEHQLKEVKSKFPDLIIGIDHTDNLNEMVQWYSAADVFLNLTYEDTFPTTNLEAMACGTPVITYAAGGSPESITPKTGIVVQVGDLEGVEKALNKVRILGRGHFSRSCTRHMRKYDRDNRFKEYVDRIYAGDESIDNEKNM